MIRFELTSIEMYLEPRIQIYEGEIGKSKSRPKQAYSLHFVQVPYGAIEPGDMTIHTTDVVFCNRFELGEVYSLEFIVNGDFH